MIFYKEDGAGGGDGGDGDGVGTMSDFIVNPEGNFASDWRITNELYEAALLGVCRMTLPPAAPHAGRAPAVERAAVRGDALDLDEEHVAAREALGGRVRLHGGDRQLRRRARAGVLHGATVQHAEAGVCAALVVGACGDSGTSPGPPPETSPRSAAVAAGLAALPDAPIRPLENPFNQARVELGHMLFSGGQQIKFLKRA